ncbi:MAG: hypothetical protein WA175_10220, partial [Candidatus Acidiferrales bacterium]
VDASADARAVFSHLKVKILRLLENDSQKEFLSMPAIGAFGHPPRRAEEDAIAAALHRQSVARNLMLVSQPFTVPAQGNGNGHGALEQK